MKPTPSSSFYPPQQETTNAAPIIYMSDQLIVATAQDAMATKFAAVQAGYYQDPFVRAFCKPSSQQRPVQVIIKRGTYARVLTVSRVVESFLAQVARDSSLKSGSSSKEQPGHLNGAVAQVVVLGAGQDTAYFRLLWQQQQQGQQQCESSSSTATETHTKPIVLRWIEVDHQTVLQEKAAIVHAGATSAKDEAALFRGVSVRGGKTGEDPFVMEIIHTSSTTPTTTTLRSSCHFVAHDLRDDPRTLCDKLLSSSSSKSLLDANYPTLFVSECVLMYLPDRASQRLFSTLSSKFPQGVCCLYEPILGQDNFGRMMQDNLTRAGVAGVDSGLVQTRTIRMHLDKLSKAGWTQGIGCDLYEAYERSILTTPERLRANQCEFLDELEEFVLIMRHYCLIVACAPSSRVGQILCRSTSSPLAFSKGRFEETSP